MLVEANENSAPQESVAPQHVMPESFDHWDDGISRIRLFGIDIDPLQKSEAVNRLMNWVHNDPVRRHRYVVTPNVDHLVMLREHAGMQAAYVDADMVITDGMPIVLASRFLKKPVPERVTGADLVPALFEAATSERPLTTYLLGAGAGVAEEAAKNIESRWPAVSVVGTYSPPFGFENDAAENDAILQRIRDAKPDTLVVGLGAPKQELWVHQHRQEIDAKISFCVGATIDFLSGQLPRAPQWMQNFGLEWFYRTISEPRRLFKRYAYDAMIFPQLVWKEWRGGSR